MHLLIHIPFVGIYYSVTRRTISNFASVIGSLFFIEIVVVLIATNEFYFPRLFEEPPVDENTSYLIWILSILVQPFAVKGAILELRKDGKKRLKRIKEEIKRIEKDELNEMKEEVK